MDIKGINQDMRLPYLNRKKSLQNIKSSKSLNNYEEDISDQVDECCKCEFLNEQRILRVHVN